MAPKKTDAPTPDGVDVGGRPPWEPTDLDRGRVQGYAEAGFTHEQIAKRVGIDVKTLAKHCGDILEFARMDLIVGIARNAFRAALGAQAQFDGNGNCVRAEVLPQAWAICFILKTIGRKLGLGFTERLEITGKDGDPLLVGLTAVMTKLSDEELAVIDHAQRILAAHAPELAGPQRDGETAH